MARSRGVAVRAQGTQVVEGCLTTATYFHDVINL